jgi:hypothetical protein
MELVSIYLLAEYFKPIYLRVCINGFVLRFLQQNKCDIQ